MKPIEKIFLCALPFIFAAASSSGQSYSIDWHKIAGGGGTSGGTNGSAVFTLSGTIGQHDAGTLQSGGGFTITGGFWSFISVVQTEGLPALAITRAGQSVVVLWPNTGNYALQQSTNLAAQTGWTLSGYTVTTLNGTNTITISQPTGNLFFRLASP